MAENSKISWTNHTFNPWIGCTRKSEGCRYCYAEDMMDRRYGRVKWGPQGTRSRTSAGNWQQPRKWDTAAAKAGIRYRVFCASLADLFDDHPSIAPEWRADLWRLVSQTPNLDWLLLTKRPENWPLFLPVAECQPPFEHVRLGVTMENQDALDERGEILAFADAAGWPTFISYEPAIGPVDWTPLLRNVHNCWLIVGAESGPHARPFNEDWARLARDQCGERGVPFFYKQKIEGRRKIEMPDLDGRRWIEFPGAGDD